MILLVLETEMKDSRKRGNLIRAEFPHRLHLDFTRWNSGNSEKEICLNLLIQEIRRIRNPKTPHTSEQNIETKPSEAGTPPTFSKHTTPGGLSSEEACTLFRSPLLFDSKVQRKASELLEGTRKWLFNDTLEWFHHTFNDPKQNVYLLQGPPGTGKSVFTCSVATKMSSCLVGIFCFDYLEMKSMADDPIYTFIYSIAYQLSRNIPDIANDVITVAKNLQYQRDVSTLFTELILNPLRKLKQMHKASLYLLIIDGIDECRNRSEFMQYLLGLIIPELSIFVKIFISSRSAISFTSTLKECGFLGGCSFNLISDVEEHLDEDVQFYLQAQFPHQPNVVSKLLEKSERNFLYLILVCKELRNNHSEDTDQQILTFIDQELPCGLNNYYSYYIRRLEKQEGWQKYLKAIICSLKPLALCEIRVLSGLDDVQQHFLTFQELFPAEDDSDGDEWEEGGENEKADGNADEGEVDNENEDEDWEHSIKPFHLSIVDWLKEAKSFPDCYIDPVEGNRFVLGNLMKEISSDLNYSSVEKVEKQFRLKASYLLSKQWKICYYILMSLAWIEFQLIFTGLDELRSSFLSVMQSVPKVSAGRIIMQDLQYLSSFFRLFSERYEEIWSVEILNQLYVRSRVLFNDDICLPVLCRSDITVARNASETSDVSYGSCEFIANPNVPLITSEVEESSFEIRQVSRLVILNEDLKNWFSKGKNKVSFLAPTLPQHQESFSSINGVLTYPFPLKALIPLPMNLLLVCGSKQLVIANLRSLMNIYEFELNIGGMTYAFATAAASDKFIFVNMSCRINSGDYINLIAVFTFKLNLLCAAETGLAFQAREHLLCLDNDELLICSADPADRAVRFKYLNGTLSPLPFDSSQFPLLRRFDSVHDNRSIAVTELESLQQIVSQGIAESGQSCLLKSIQRNNRDYLLYFVCCDVPNTDFAKWIRVGACGNCEIIATIRFDQEARDWYRAEHAILLPEKMEIIAGGGNSYDLLSIQPLGDAGNNNYSIKLIHKIHVRRNSNMREDNVIYHAGCDVTLFIALNADHFSFTDRRTLEVVDYKRKQNHCKKMVFKSSQSPIFELSMFSDKYLLSAEGWEHSLAIPLNERIETPLLPVHSEFVGFRGRQFLFHPLTTAGPPPSTEDYYTVFSSSGAGVGYIISKKANEPVTVTRGVPHCAYLFISPTEALRIDSVTLKKGIFFNPFTGAENGTFDLIRCITVVRVNASCLLMIGRSVVSSSVVYAKRDLINRNVPNGVSRELPIPLSKIDLNNFVVVLKENLLVLISGIAIYVLEYRNDVLFLVAHFTSSIEFLNTYLPVVDLDTPIKIPHLNELFYCETKLVEFMKVSDEKEKDFYGVSRRYIELVITEVTGHTHWIAYFL
jgi:hypothetical protein